MGNKPRNGWLVFAAIYYYSVVASFNLLKVPPLFGMLMPEFGLNEATVGYIVSASSIAGLILEFPSALIAKRIGTYRTGLIAIALSITGCVIGALAPNLPVLLVGRFIEGCGLGMTGAVGSYTIPQYFTGKKMGLPMAIWPTWFAVGSALGSLLSGRIGYSFANWRASWWAGAILAAIGFVIFAAIVRENKTAFAEVPKAAVPQSAVKKQSDFALGVKNLRIWLIGVYTAAMLISCVGFLSFGTEFFSAAYGMEKADAGALASLGFWFTPVGGVLAGIVSRVRRGNSLKGQLIQIVICSVLCVAVYPFGFLIGKQWIVPFLFVCGLINGYTCGAGAGTVAYLVHHPRVIGISMGIIFVCQNFSSLCAAPVIGACIKGGNWSGAVIPVLCITGFGVICAVAAMMLSLRKERKDLAAAAE